MICNDRMYRIQADADAGRIGGAIRIMMNRRKGYKMECLVDGDECLSDPDKVDLRAFEHFKQWFSRSEKEKELGIDIDNMIRKNGEEAFHEKAKEMGIGMKASERVWKGMKKKNISEEGKLEG